MPVFRCNSTHLLKLPIRSDKFTTNFKNLTRSNLQIPEKEYTMEEVAKHNKKDDLWIAIKGTVLDVTN
ncbi:fumarate reductase Osm1 [Penicillium frequentans]|uniref:Fumarate reductase Osm1 n=1 Tax=Penicillium frequentans TaxID=3151616 RepID=A0AAD6CZW2_9EURO|nr:fumarate reductase Osm1 [Penicillium glabrum]